MPGVGSRLARARCAVQGTIPSSNQRPSDCWLLRDSVLILIQPLLGIGILMILGNFGSLELLLVDAAPLPVQYQVKRVGIRDACRIYTHISRQTCAINRFNSYPFHMLTFRLM